MSAEPGAARGDAAPVAEAAATAPSRPRRPRGAVVRPRPGTGTDPAAGEGAAGAAAAGRSRGSRVPRGPAKQRRLIETAGPNPATPLDQVRLVVGTIIGTHGVRGEAKLRLATDDPDHLRTIKRVWLGTEARSRRLLGVRIHGGNALIRLSGISTPEQVDAVRGLELRIAGSDARPNEEGEFFLFQLVGLRAHDESGALLGTLSDVLETGAHDVFVITSETGPDLLVPNHPQFVLDIQPDEGTLTVRPPVYAEPGG